MSARISITQHDGKTAAAATATNNEKKGWRTYPSFKCLRFVEDHIVGCHFDRAPIRIHDQQKHNFSLSLSFSVVRYCRSSVCTEHEW